MQSKRRKDLWTAERIELAALTARAFHLHAAKSFLRLSGVRADLIDSFVARYPEGLRSPAAAEDGRRRSGPAT